ncbi:DUF4198 domain-containing protein [uncultured Novosphingobium sp.]|uniref:DUF4198 domain-containing protein n=1 Tax=uncultured Novosphingobium sp. TaxID=292277 RepID=UPI00258D735C|nr:DUF4198 domain-containing protein [uncultured Novosphingobium sp.]
MNIRHALIAAAAFGSALSTPARAHRQWLLPSTTTLAGTSEYVTVDGAVSNDLFYADHFPIDPAQIKVWAPDGTEGQVENAATLRYRSTFDVKIDKPGTWVIGMERTGLMGSFKVNGETWRVGNRGRNGGGGAGGRMPGPAMNRPAGEAAPKFVATAAEIPADATDVKLSETIARNYVYVTADAPTAASYRVTGKGLEFQPITLPGSLVADEEGQFRFLVDGKPAAGLTVAVVPGGKKYREAEDAQELKTGADGVLHVKWPVPGMYWLNATTTDAKTTEPKATERRLSFTTVLEVVAP